MVGGGTVDGWLTMRKQASNWRNLACVCTPDLTDHGEQSTRSSLRADIPSVGNETESDVILGLRDELESCQQNLAQKKELLLSM